MTFNDTATSSNVSNNAAIEDGDVTSGGGECVDGGSKWGSPETLKLIQLYSDNKDRFESTTKRNHRVWLDITIQMVGRNIDQVRNRWKYLKQKYKLVKDNMDGKVTRTERIKFE